MTSPVDAWFQAQPEQQSELLSLLRRLVKSVDGGFSEELKWGRPCYALDRMVCYLHTTKSHVNLGFEQGARMTDPQGLLQGTGKSMRHIKFTSADDVDVTAVQAMIREAVDLSKAA